jgi:hypothetical protein
VRFGTKRALKLNTCGISGLIVGSSFAATAEISRGDGRWFRASAATPNPCHPLRCATTYCERGEGVYYCRL